MCCLIGWLQHYYLMMCTCHLVVVVVNDVMQGTCPLPWWLARWRTTSPAGASGTTTRWARATPAGTTPRASASSCCSSLSGSSGARSSTGSRICMHWKWKKTITMPAIMLMMPIRKNGAVFSEETNERSSSFIIYMSASTWSELLNCSVMEWALVVVLLPSFAANVVLFVYLYFLLILVVVYNEATALLSMHRYPYYCI